MFGKVCAHNSGITTESRRYPPAAPMFISFDFLLVENIEIVIPTLF